MSLRPLCCLPLLLAAPGLAGQTPPAPPVALTLDQALARGLQANPLLGRQRAEVAAAQALKKGTLSQILPRLTATGGLIRNNKEVSFGSGEDARTVLPENDWNARLVLQQPVFAGLREQRAYQQSKEAVRSAEQGLRAAEDRLLLGVARDYLQVVQGDLLVGVERQAEELARRRLAQARDLLEAGEVTRVDVLRAEADVAAAERAVALAERDRGVAAGQLRVDLALEGELVVQEPTLDVPEPPGEAELLERAERARGDLQQAAIGVHVAQLEVSKQKGFWLPVVTADAGWVWQATSFPSDRYGFAALRFSVPLWQSGEVQSRVALARERQRQAELALEDARLRVREDVRRAQLDAATARRYLKLAQDQLAASQAEYDQVFELYRSQEATSLDAQSSETSLNEARRAVVNGRLASALAVLEVWFAAGDLKSVLVKEARQ